MTNAVENYMAALNGAAPDMGALAKLGVPMAEAISICSAAHKPAEVPPLPYAPEPMPERAASVADALSKLPRFAPEPEFAVAPLAPEVPNLRLDMYMPPVPRCPAIAAHQEPVHELSALSLLHTLITMVESGRADITVLVQQGFSPHTAEELSALIRSANPVLVSPTRSLT